MEIVGLKGNHDTGVVNEPPLTRVVKPTHIDLKLNAWVEVVLFAQKTAGARYRVTYVETGIDVTMDSLPWYIVTTEKFDLCCRKIGPPCSGVPERFYVDAAMKLLEREAQTMQYTANSGPIRTGLTVNHQCVCLGDTLEYNNGTRVYRGIVGMVNGEASLICQFVRRDNGGMIAPKVKEYRRSLRRILNACRNHSNHRLTIVEHKE